MGTISSTPVTALSVLTAPGAPLSNGSSLIPQSVLKAASPADLSSLSAEASALSEEGGLFGLPTPNYGQTTPDFFQSIDSSITNAAFGLAPAAPGTTDLLAEGLANLNGTSTTQPAATTTVPPSLDQLVSSYSGVTNNTGTVINTTG
ncbi:MAG TPA: hypothetical protein VGP62_16050 [Bryobacteraceae bacterium]|jgi:hypothetical protein|nr:hypothetical protein [Bryobacteraceae bacterium]